MTTTTAEPTVNVRHVCGLTGEVTYVPVRVRYLCALTGEIMHVPVRMREDRDGFPIYRGCVCERKALLAMMRGDPVFAGLTTTELRALLEPVSDLGEEIQRDMRDKAKAEFQAAETKAGRQKQAWRVSWGATYTKIRDVVPQAIHAQAHSDEIRAVQAFMNARCQGDMWKPRDEDILMAAEISRWHTRKDIQGNMYRALATALDLPGGILSESQKVLARNGYFHAMESHFAGGQDVWVLNSVKWCKMELAKQDWDNNALVQDTMCKAVENKMLHGETGPFVMSEAETECVGNGYACSVEHCEYNDTSARVDWGVNWAVKKINENRAQPDEEMRKALVDESLRNEAKQSRKREREEHLERKQKFKRLMQDSSRTSRTEVLKKLETERDRQMYISALVYGTVELEFAYKHVMERREMYEKKMDTLSRAPF